MKSAAVQRHKIVTKSKLPFNSLMKEIRNVVPKYEAKEISSRLIISKKMRNKLDRRFISTKDIRIAIAKGHRRKENRKTTRAPGGNKRLLTDHEKGRKTILKEYYSSCSRVLRRSVPSICVRYVSSDKGYIIVDAYKPNAHGVANPAPRHNHGQHRRPRRPHRDFER